MNPELITIYAGVSGTPDSTPTPFVLLVPGIGPIQMQPPTLTEQTNEA